jgi:hypothetical protein
LLLEHDAVIEANGTLYQPDETFPPYDADRLAAIDWRAAGIDIRRESQGPERDATSIQAYMIARIAEDETWEVILDDDGKGEVADIVAMKSTNIDLTLRLLHCKFSSVDQPGCRLKDLYELCGQAQKSGRRRANLEPDPVSRTRRVG